MSSENKEKSEANINIGCGCLTDIIAIILIIIICDLLGCEWCHGFVDKANKMIHGDNVHEIHPSDLR